jgi:hypothetical protein
VITAARYKPGVAGAGRVVGTITVEGDAPRDTVVKPDSNRLVCGASFTDRTVRRSGSGLGDVVVWLADVKTGKALPLGRRFDVGTDRCQILPRVQAAVTGGTLNVSSSDALVHETRFTQQGSGDTLGTVSESERGSVVPVRRPLAKAGLVRLTNPGYPWARAWVAVFDHPYFAVTGPDGRFTLDSVPPGTYTLRAWHDRFGVTEQKVTVGAGEASVTVTLAAK